MKKTILIILSAIISIGCQAQKAQKKKKKDIERERYEIEKELPCFLDQIKRDLTYPLAWGNTKDKSYKKWQKKAKEKVFECMLKPLPKTCKYDLKIIDTQQRDGYKALKIEFNISEFSRVPAYLLIPDSNGKHPAIVTLHDHGAHFGIGKEKMIRPFNVDSLVINDADMWSVKCYDNQYVGDVLASKGYVVLAVDALFWGERGRKEGINYESQQALACNMMMLGYNWSGLITYEDIYSVDFLASLDFVDKDNIGSFGFSMGAYRSWMLSALSDRVKAGAALCWITTTDNQLSWETAVNKGGSAYSMMLPGIRNYLDYAHIASIACPKPMLFFNGTKDKLFPVEGVTDAYSILKDVWKSQNASDKLVTKFWDSPHFCSKAILDEIIIFYDQNLK